MNLGNVKIGIRLGLGFGVVLLLVAIMAISNLSSMSQVQKNFDENVKVTDVKVDTLYNLRQVIMLAIVTGRNIALLTEAADIEDENKKLAAARAEYVQLFDKIGSMATPAEKVLLEKITSTRSDAIAAQKRVAALSQASEKDAAMRMTIKEVQPLQVKTLEAIEALIAHIGKKANEENEKAAATNTSMRLFTIAMAILCLVVGSVTAWRVAHGITKPLDKAVNVARRVASGDLTADIVVESRDETGQLMQALKDMNANLLATVSQVRAGTDTIAAASSQIATGNLDLSSRTEEEASSLEETSSSMHELTSTVNQTADHAREANQLAATASQVAIKGGAVVAQVVDRMGAINHSARQIADIIGVIDGIAFQTNILALNAAVEAARAGEQGRGFAVVATEVRNLAQRSATAAKEIKSLITTSVDEVTAGSALVAQAGATMEEIVASVKHVSDIIAEIANASREQSIGIEQVNRAIDQMDKVTQQNAALVEESAAVADSMREQAAVLQKTVSVFNTGATSSISSAVAKTSLRRAEIPARQRIAAAPATQNAVVPATQKKVSNGVPVANNEWEEF
jgi:methyl-accepting chemotaxis protein